MMTTPSRRDQLMMALADAQVRAHTYAVEQFNSAILGVIAADLTTEQANLLGAVRWEIAGGGMGTETVIAGEVRSDNPVDKARIVTAIAATFGIAPVQVRDDDEHVILIEAATVIAGFTAAVEAVWWTTESGEPRPNRAQVQTDVADMARRERDDEDPQQYPLYDINETFE